jgi:hypothetical protein
MMLDSAAVTVFKRKFFYQLAVICQAGLKKQRLVKGHAIPYKDAALPSRDTFYFQYICVFENTQKHYSLQTMQST